MLSSVMFKLEFDFSLSFLTTHWPPARCSSLSFHDGGLVTSWAKLLITYYSYLPNTPKDCSTIRAELAGVISNRGCWSNKVRCRLIRSKSAPVLWRYHLLSGISSIEWSTDQETLDLWRLLVRLFEAKLVAELPGSGSASDTTEANRHYLNFVVRNVFSIQVHFRFAFHQSLTQFMPLRLLKLHGQAIGLVKFGKVELTAVFSPGTLVFQLPEQLVCLVLLRKKSKYHKDFTSKWLFDFD